MEAFSTGASAMAFIGITGQLIQGTSFLINLFHAIKDAPEDVVALRDELETLLAILRGTRGMQCLGDSRSSSVTENLNLALAQCFSSIDGLVELVRECEPRAGGGSWERFRKQLFSAVHTKKFSKHTQKLERAKTTLLNAMLIVTR